MEITGRVLVTDLIASASHRIKVALDAIYNLVTVAHLAISALRAIPDPLLTRIEI